MIILAVEIFDIIRLSCYVLALITSLFVVMSIDYKKFMQIKSNYHVYIASFALTCCMTYLIGEFLYSILTMFIK